MLARRCRPLGVQDGAPEPVQRVPLVDRVRDVLAQLQRGPVIVGSREILARFEPDRADAEQRGGLRVALGQVDP